MFGAAYKKTQTARRWRNAGPPPAQVPRNRHSVWNTMGCHVFRWLGSLLWDIHKWEKWYLLLGQTYILWFLLCFEFSMFWVMGNYYMPSQGTDKRILQLGYIEAKWPTDPIHREGGGYRGISYVQDTLSKIRWNWCSSYSWTAVWPLIYSLLAASICI